ncbi:ABC-type sugar transport system permease subunit [Paenibacillus brasilensis]|uniref:ABC-type sugar transport system permease subunit n=1 Tax=Paenibacillus brasilensis TaxID=128574 RepID=A0ABU0L3K1_9BACL|nr:ABC-type sugar transport system permease subunit [Paenibacillus brasilensis]
MESWTRSWLTEPQIAMYALYFVALWQYFGYHLLIQFTGVQNIPHELYEAAKIDGAEGFKADRYITLPLMVPIIKISMVLAFIGSLQSFDLIWVMTGGGPAHATDIYVQYVLFINEIWIWQRIGFDSRSHLLVIYNCDKFCFQTDRK